MDKWQPIETAPKDGRDILVPYPLFDRGNATNIPDAYKIMIVYWNGRGWDSHGWMLHQTPQRWQPIPDPPPIEPAW